MSYRQAFSAMYARNFERRPWLTLAVTNGALGVIADGAAQTLERISQAQSRQQELERRGGTASDASTNPSEGKGWDLARSGRFMAFNVGMAPLLAEWNKFLEFRFPLRSSSAGGTGAASTVANAASAAGKVSFRALGNRLLMDQLVL